MYVFFLDAAPTERLLTQSGSLFDFLEEEADLGAEGGGKLRTAILRGASSHCVAPVRAMALVCDAVLWPALRAIKPADDVHALDVLLKLWPALHAFFESAALRPAGVIDGSLCFRMPGASPPPPPATPKQARDAMRCDAMRLR